MESWQKILAVQRMQDYIEDNIKSPITLNALAKVAEYSPYYSARIFKELTGKAPFDYIRSLRLAKAAVMLSEVKSRVIDVAFDFVFDSHEGFTRAFSKEFGISPKKFSQEKKDYKVFMPNNARDYYLTALKGVEKMNKNSTVFVQVVDRPQRKLILKRGVKATHYFEYCEEVGCEVWEVLSNIKNALNEPMGLWLPPNMVKDGTSIYAQGVEVPADYTGEIPAGYDIIDLEPCKIMIFQGPPYDDEKFEDAIGDLWERMAEYKPETYGFKWADEMAPRFQLEPMGYRGYIEGKPVRTI